jgi:hypothetical protein
MAWNAPNNVLGRHRHSARRGRMSILMAVLVLAVVIGAFAGSVANGPASVALSAGEVRAARGVAFGAFLGSEQQGVARVAAFDAWLGVAPGGPGAMSVGHTYLPGDNWSDIEGDPQVLDPWTAWHRQTKGSLLVLNVPMLPGNEIPTDDSRVAELLREGASGADEDYFKVLAQRLVALGSGDAVIVPGWEMNGTTYTDRCAPDPSAWQRYWREIVATMRSVPGAGFRFDFDPSRGTDDIDWKSCYPGDASVDIIGMDSYDQVPGMGFADYVDQPDGLAEQVAFAAAHHKPVSYPEWGLYRFGDDSGYVSAMLAWIGSHDVVYETITDYCPHGVFECTANPNSSAAYKAAMGTG